jgi:hypothetical protein
MREPEPDTESVGDPQPHTHRVSVAFPFAERDSLTFTHAHGDTNAYRHTHSSSSHTSWYPEPEPDTSAGPDSASAMDAELASEAAADTPEHVG